MIKQWTEGRGIIGGHKEIFGGDRCVHYLDRGDDFMGVCIG